MAKGWPRRGTWGASKRTWRNTGKVKLTDVDSSAHAHLHIFPSHPPAQNLPSALCPPGAPNLTSSRRPSLITPAPLNPMLSSPEFPGHPPSSDLPMWCLFITSGRHCLELLMHLGFFLHVLECLFHVDEAFPVSLGLLVFFSFALILLGSWCVYHLCNLALAKLFNLLLP